MATLLQTYNGNTAKNASQTNQHYVRARLYLDSNTGSGYTMHWVWDVYLIKWTAGVGRTFTYKYGGTSTTFDQSYKSVSNVAVQTKTGGSFTVAYGSSCSTTAQAVWYTDGGTAQNSTLSASYTVPRPTYTISYNANGGSGAPSNQTKVYGTNITLSTIVPTREAYIFKGWSTSSTATTATYQPGGTFSTNANTVLYAVWSLIKTNSKITSMKLKRCLQDGTEDNEGTYCKITVNYVADISQDADNTIVRLKWSFSNDESGIININQAEGSNVIINQNELSLEENCSATVLITDEYTDDGSETFEEYSDLQKRLVYAPSLLKRPKLYIKNWYNTKVSEYGDSLIEFPDELNSALGSDKLYANTIQNDEEIFNNYTLNLTSDNIAESTFNDLIIEGQSVQDGTPTPDAPMPIVSVEGRNLLDPLDRMGGTGSTSKGITCTINPDGWIDVSGTVTGTSAGIISLWGLNTDNNYIFPAGSYAMSVETEGFEFTSKVKLQLWYDNSAYYVDSASSHVIPFTCSQGVNRVRLFMSANATGTTVNGRFRVQLERGTTAHDYQPYGCVTLVAKSRNLLDANYFVSTAGGQTYYSVNEDVLTVLGSDGRGWATMPAFILSAGTYTLSRSNGSGGTYVKKMVDGQPTAGYILTLPDGTLSGTFTLSEATIVSIRLGYTASSYPFDVRVQLELGTTATAYTPYVNFRTDIDLQGHALRSLPDGTHDELRVDSLGRVTMTQRVGSVTLDGDASIWSASGGSVRAVIAGSAFVQGNDTAQYFYASRFVAATHRTAGLNNVLGTAAFWANVSNEQQRRITLNTGDTSVVNVDTAKAWLAANPTTVIYPLATPQTIDLGTIELPVISENNTISIDALVSPTLNISYNENIIYADELNDLFIYLYNAGEWNDNSDPLTGTSSAHIIDIAHSALSGFYFAVPDGTVIQRIEKLYTYNGGSFTDSVTNELWNITSEGNTVSDEILILQGGNA